MTGIADLQAGLYTKLSADTALAALIGARIYDEPPADPVYPFIQIGDDAIDDWGAQDIKGYRVESSVVVWSQGERGRKTVKQISDAIYAALHQKNLTVTGHTVILCRFLSATSDTLDGTTWRNEQKFLIILQSN